MDLIGGGAAYIGSVGSMGITGERGVPAVFEHTEDSAMRKTHKFPVWTVMAALCLTGVPAMADEAADAAKRAELYQVAAGKTYNTHAHDHARMLGKYAAATAQPVPREVIQEHTAAIRANVKRAQTAYAKLGVSAKSNPNFARQLAEITKRLAQVSAQVNQLETQNSADSKLVVTATDSISQDLKATHPASKEIDQALTAAAATTEKSGSFDNPQDSSYYFTGEGHFID